MDEHEPSPVTDAPAPRRRTFLASLPAVAMGGGLAAGYGSFAAVAGRFLYPAGGAPMRWHFVAPVAEIPSGSSKSIRTPGGEEVTISRRGPSGPGEEADFLALSTTCPHLGCRVHWEGNNNRFFCPCHNGVFDPSGKAVSGPPAQAGQDLPRYPMKVEDGLLFIGIREAL